jgi:competence ComEA-like helix-hairpin-helix protein
MNIEPKSSQTITPVRMQQLVLLILGLCLAGLWAWRAGLVWPPSPALTPPQQHYFIEIRGDLPHPGVQVFLSPPTIQEVWETAGGQGAVSNPSQPLNNGTKITITSDRAVTLERMSGHYLLTLGLALDPNQATATDLEAIPGIGPVLAKRIVEFREEHGPFRKLENLLEVKGLGPKILEKIGPYVVIISNDEKIQ